MYETVCLSNRRAGGAPSSCAQQIRFFLTSIKRQIDPQFAHISLNAQFHPSLEGDKRSNTPLC